MSKMKKLGPMEIKVRKNKKLGVQNVLPKALSFIRSGPQICPWLSSNQLKGEKIIGLMSHRSVD